MSPTLGDGDFVITKKKHPLSVGKVVIIEHPELGRIIKRIVSLDGKGGFLVSGDNYNTTPTEIIGLVNERSITYTVICRVSLSGFSKL